MQRLATIPEFRCPASTGQTLSYRSFRGKVSLVLLFLPDLTSPGGLVTLSELAGLHKSFGDQRCQVLAVVKATPRQVREFAAATDLTIPILADAGGAMIRDFGLADGYTGQALPAVVVADRHGQVVHRSEPPELDADGILALVRGLGDTATDGTSGTHG